MVARVIYHIVAEAVSSVGHLDQLKGLRVGLESAKAKARELVLLVTENQKWSKNA